MTSPAHGRDSHGHAHTTLSKKEAHQQSAARIEAVATFIREHPEDSAAINEAVQLATCPSEEEAERVRRSLASTVKYFASVPADALGAAETTTLKTSAASGDVVPYFQADGSVPAPVVKLLRSRAVWSTQSLFRSTRVLPIVPFDPEGASPYAITEQIEQDVLYLIHQRDPAFSFTVYTPDLKAKDFVVTTISQADLAATRAPAALPFWGDIVQGKVPRETLGPLFLARVGLEPAWAESFLKNFEDEDSSSRFLSVCTLRYLVLQCDRRKLPFSLDELFVLISCITRRPFAKTQNKPQSAAPQRPHLQALTTISRWIATALAVASLNDVFLKPYDELDSCYLCFDGLFIRDVLVECARANIPRDRLFQFLSVQSLEMFQAIYAAVTAGLINLKFPAFESVHSIGKPAVDESTGKKKKAPRTSAAVGPPKNTAPTRTVNMFAALGISDGEDDN